MGRAQVTAPSSSGLGYLVFIQKIAGSNPAGVTVVFKKMPEIIEIPNSQTKYLNESALQEFKSTVKKFVKDLINEANRLEDLHHSSTNDPEITSSMIKDAAEFLRKGYLRSKKSLLTLCIDVVVFLGAIVTGWLYKPELFKTEENSLYIFLAVFVGTILVFIWSKVRD